MTLAGMRRLSDGVHPDHRWIRYLLGGGPQAGFNSCFSVLGWAFFLLLIGAGVIANLPMFAS